MQKNNDKSLEVQVCKRLKELRKAKHLTQKQICADPAFNLDINEVAYSRYETGFSNMPIDFIVSICKYFGVTTDYLLMGVEEGITPDRKITKKLNLMNQKDKETVCSFLTAIADSLKDDKNKS